MIDVNLLHYMATNEPLHIEEIDTKIYNLNSELNKTKEDTIQIRERKASSGATIEGLKKRKSDLLERVESELNLNENNDSGCGYFSGLSKTFST